MPGKKDVDIVSRIRALIRDEVKGIYTASTCIVEDVDEEDRRVEVSLKSDEHVFVDNVPIASPFGGDEKGMIVPVEQEDEGVLLHLREPFSDQIQESGHVEPSGERRHTLEDCIFLPMLWLDDMDVPDHEEGEFLIALQEDGSVFSMLPDGEVTIEHQSGNVIQMSPDGTVTLGNPESAAAVLTEDAELTDGEGESVTIEDPGSEDTEAS